MDREKLEAKQQDVAAEPSTTPPSSPPLGLPLPPPPASLPSGLAALRISTPFMAIPGLRTAVPRPRPPVARPQPMNRAAAGTTALPALQLGTTVDASGGVASPIAPAAVVASTMPRLSSSEPPLLPSHLCSAYFVEPLSWMAPLLDSGILAGKIVCPGAKCGAKLGSYDWAGLRKCLYFYCVCMDTDGNVPSQNARVERGSALGSHSTSARRTRSCRLLSHTPSHLNTLQRGDHRRALGSGQGIRV